MPLLSGSGKAPAGFGDLFRNMAQGCALHEILTDGQGQAVDYVYLEVNPAFERLTGLSRDGILGRRVTEVLAGIEPSWIETYGRVALTGEPASFERYFPAPLDRWYQVFAYQPAPKQFVSILVDITDRHRIEEELRASEAKFRQIFNGANVGKSLTLPTGEIEFNAAFCEMLGYTAAELAAKRWQDLTPAEEIEPVEKLLEPLLRGEKDSARFTKRYIRKDGSLIWGDVSTRMVRDAAGRPRHFITTVIDITPRKSAEEQLERTNRRIKDILASIQDDFYVLDRDWRFVFVSRQFTSKVGREPKDFVGNSIWELFPKHLGTAYEENLRSAMDRREVRRFEIRGQYTDAVYRMTVFPSADGITVLGTDITEQKRTEEAARESDERLRFALETSRIGAWDLDLVDHTAYRSLDHDRIFGYEELLPEWTYEMFLGHVIPEDREEVDARFRRAAATKGMWNFECRIRRAGGEIRWIWAAGRHRLGPSGEASRMVGIVQDITERKEAEALRQALAEQENLRLGAAVEQAPDAIVMLGLDGAIRYANAAFGFINRMAKDAAKGRSYFDAFAPESSAASIRAAMADGRVWQGHMTRTVGEGQPVELEVAIAAIRDPAGSVIGGLVTEKDVTYETALQRQLRQSQKMEALGTLAGGIAHDFNNILNPIFISMELALLEPDLDLGIRRHLEVGLKAAERGRDLVKQVIAFSRQKERERRPVEAAPAVREVVKFLRVSLPSTVEIKADIEDEVGLILGDPAQIQQIVMNLCANAAYAMRLAGGVLVVSLGRVEVDAELAARVPGLKIGSYVRLVVADTGSGMTPAVRERIFDPFFTTKGPGEGSGMGLPVVDGIVRNYDGAIAVESEEGRGSAFTVYLPRAEGPLGEDEGAPETLPRGSGRILLVDDEAVQIYSVRSLLEKLGYGVVAITDGREALERFRADPEAFDLVVTDQTMPHLTGLQLASGMLGIRPDIPIILCTGYSEAVDAKTAHAAGIREFLMKPYSVREMAEVIRRTL